MAAIHTLIMFDLTRYLPGVIAIAVLAQAGLWIAGRGLHKGAWILVLVAGLLGAAQVFLLSGSIAWVRSIFIFPVLVQAWLTWFFLRTLLPGREPLIRRISRAHRDPFPAELEVYTRRLTILWAGFLATSTGISALTALLAPASTWSWVVNIALPGASVGFFLLEHLYRHCVFGHLGGHSPLATMRAMASPQLWRTL